MSKLPYILLAASIVAAIIYSSLRYRGLVDELHSTRSQLLKARAELAKPQPAVSLPPPPPPPPPPPQSQPPEKTCNGIPNGYVPHANSTLCEPLVNRRYPGTNNKKVISYSMFASEDGSFVPFLLEGLRKNANFSVEWYPDWIMRVYIAGIKPVLLDKFRREMPHVEFVSCKQSPVHHRGMLLRFLPYDDLEVERYMVRDLDSLAGLRELLAVNEWMASGLPFHAMRDHVAHTVPVLGCSWGLTRGAFGFPSMEGYLLKEVYEKYPKERKPACCGEDQGVLSDLWPLVKDKTISHDRKTNSNCYGAKICKDYPYTRWPANERGYIGHGLKKPWDMHHAFWNCSAECRLQLVDEKPEGYVEPLD